MLTSVSAVVKQVVAHGRVNASGWVRVDCPFCQSRKGSPDTRQSFAYNSRTTGFVCNRCRIKGYVGGRVTLGASRQASGGRVSVPGGLVPLWLPDVVDSISCAPALAYLLGRGFGLADIEAGRMHAAVTGRYAGRVVVPHLAADGAWWGFTARCWARPAAGVPKVLYPAGMSRSQLYNGQALEVSTDSPVLLVEGVLDAISYLPDAAAFLGKPTEDHMQALLAAKRPLVIALDGDAWQEGRAWAQRLRMRGKTAVAVRLPAGLDPQDVDPRQLQLAATRALVDWHIDAVPELEDGRVHSQGE